MLAVGLLPANASLYVHLVSEDIGDSITVDYISLVIAALIIVSALFFGIYINHKKYQKIIQFVGWVGAISTVIVIVIALFFNAGSGFSFILSFLFLFFVLSFLEPFF